MTGRARAAAGVSAPPFDCVTNSEAVLPAAASAVSSRVRYVSINGINAAFMTVVDVRSYSRNSRESSAEPHTNHPFLSRRSAVTSSS